MNNKKAILVGGHGMSTGSLLLRIATLVVIQNPPIEVEKKPVPRQSLFVKEPIAELHKFLNPKNQKQCTKHHLLPKRKY